MNINNLFSIKNKNVIITGAGGGLGFEIANFFQNNGANVFAFDKNFNKKNFNKKIVKIKCNFFNKKNTLNVIKKILKKTKIHILINCAAITIPNSKKFSDLLLNWNKTIEINLNIPYLFCNLIGNHMIKKKIKGRIINFSSIGGKTGFPNNHSYGPSKSGLAQLSKSLANDWSKYGININTIVPGYFATEMNKSSWSNKLKKQERSMKTLLNRWGNPSEIIGSVVFLSSEASSYITGSEIIVDGGWLSKGI
jgi:NAD(P)-dependent dehydrogenase (short-subunit alcohol dehydrogenase family)